MPKKTSYNSTDKVIAVGIDGNRLAIFGGYDAPAPSEIFTGIKDAFRVFVYNRFGDIREAYWRPE